MQHSGVVDADLVYLKRLFVGTIPKENDALGCVAYPKAIHLVIKRIWLYGQLTDVRRMLTQAVQCIEQRVVPVWSISP